MASDFNARIKTKQPLVGLAGAAALILIGEANQLGGAPNYLLARTCYIVACLSLMYAAFYRPPLRDNTGNLRELLFVSLIAVGAGITWWACVNLAPPPRLLDISPKKINLKPLLTGGGTAYKIQSTLILHSITEDVLYQVWIKLTIHSPSIEPKDLTFRLSDEPTHSDGPLVISHDSTIYYGRDAKGHKAILMFFKTLRPKATIPIELSNTYSGVFGEGQSYNATVEVVGFSTDPSQMLKGDKEIQSSFSPPENFTVTGLGVLVAPKD
jgi:hypothetical protein